MTSAILAVGDGMARHQPIRIALTGAGWRVTGDVEGAGETAGAGDACFATIATGPALNDPGRPTPVSGLRGRPARAGAAGATGWLVKPFVSDQLMKVARKVLGR